MHQDVLTTGKRGSDPGYGSLHAIHIATVIRVKPCESDLSDCLHTMAYFIKGFCTAQILHKAGAFYSIENKDLVVYYLG